MEESKQSLNKMQIERRIQLLRSKNVSEEVIKLVRSDLEDGLTEEQTDIYMNKNLNIDQMKALSSCLHKGIPDEMIALLKENNLSGNQMCVSLEFYEKGVPIDAIKEIIVRGDNTIAMRSAYSKILENMEQMKKESEKAPEYVEELVEQIRDMVGKIHHQEDRYDALNKKLALIETNNGDEEVMNRLVKENSDKDAMIESQQNELNKANGTIARLRDDIEKKDKEMVRMSNRIESLEDKIMSVATQTEAAKESKIVEEPVKSESAKTAEDVAANQKLAEYNVVHIQGAMGSAAQIGRSGALDKKAEAESNWNIVKQQTATWSEDEARTIVEGVIAAGTKFNVIYAENDGMAKGAVAALDKAGITHGKDGDVIVMGFDCNKWALEALLKGEWNYDGQCNPFQAETIDGIIKQL